MSLAVREEPLIFKPGQFYVIRLLSRRWSHLPSWGFVVHAPLVPSAILAIAITFVFRLLAILFDWKTRSIIRSVVQRSDSAIDCDLYSCSQTRACASSLGRKNFTGARRMPAPAKAEVQGPPSVQRLEH